jgi:heavy metal sensor kinase
VRRWFGGTRSRLTLAHGVVLTIAILVADLALFLVFSNAQWTAANDVLRSQAATITAGIEDVNGQIRFGGGDLPTETQQGVAVDAAIVPSSGPITQTPGQTLTASTLANVAASVRGQSSPVLQDIRDKNGVPRRLFAERLQVGQATDTVLIVSRSMSELQAELTRTALFLGILSLLVVVAGTLLAHWLTGRVLLPVRRITAMARSLSEHDLHRRVTVDVPEDELGELVATFNGMLARLEASFESLRRFTADASHELRSPLALMRSEVEGALHRARTPGEYQRVLRGLEEEVERMTRLVDQLLVLARADAGALRPAVADLDVADVLHEAAARWRSVAQRSGVRLEVDAPETGTAPADPDLLRRVLDNLLANAIRHSPEGTLVVLHGSKAADGWNLEVRDQGPGVPPAARALLFERFARADEARGRDSGGAGLGLALSRAIARAHRGTLELVDRGGPGATFRLFLPDPSPRSAGGAMASNGKVGEPPRVASSIP